MLDSALGGWFQASVIDTRTGKVIEGTGGNKVGAVPENITEWLTIYRYLCLGHEFLRTRRVTSRAGTPKVA